MLFALLAVVTLVRAQNATVTELAPVMTTDISG
jgi:hypothetical protein